MKAELDCSFKSRLHHHLLTMLEERIQIARELLQSSIEARNEDTKSSAGDKYETGRAMMQQQIDMHQAELHKTEVLLNAVKNIDPKTKTNKVAAGSLVNTTLGIYYFSVGIGKVDFELQEIFMLSPAAPLAQYLIDKRSGDEVHFSGRVYKITGIC